MKNTETIGGGGGLCVGQCYRFNDIIISYRYADEAQNIAFIMRWLPNILYIYGFCG